MPTELYQTVSDLVEEELSLYMTLGELIDDEESRVNEQDTEGLLEVLSKKQNVISRQEALLEQWSEISASFGLSEVREGPSFWGQLAERIGEVGCRRISERIDEVKALGQALLNREETIRAKLEANIAEMRRKLLSMGRNRAALRGYSQGMATGI